MATLSLTAPLPILAEYWALAPRSYITFDQACRPGSLDLTVWTFNLDLRLFTPTSCAWLNPTTLAIYGNEVVGPPSTDTVDYTPPPNVVRSMALVPNPGFTNYPVVVYP